MDDLWVCVVGGGRSWQKWGEQQQDCWFESSSVSLWSVLNMHWMILCDMVLCFLRMSRTLSKWFLKKAVNTEVTSLLYCRVQEAFFGKDLLDKSKQSRQQGVESGLLEEGQSQVERKHPATSFLDPSSDPLLSSSTTSLPTRSTAARTYTQCFGLEMD